MVKKTSFFLSPSFPMQEKAEDHMGSSHPQFSPHFLRLLSLFLLLIAATSCVYLLSSAFFTALVMVLPTSLFFAFSKRKQLQESNSNLVGRPYGTEVSCDDRTGNGIFELHKHALCGGGGHPINGFVDGSPKTSTVSEGEAEEILLDSVDQIPAYSDSSMSDDESREDPADPIPASSDGSASDDESSAEGTDRPPAPSESSITDEESLIEIALPDGHPVWPEEPKSTIFRPNSQGFQPGFSPDLVLRQQQQQQDLLELFSEMNEEDNLIEIDIARGSVKCSRLGITA